MALKYLQKFDYFVPCFYDFKKKRTSDENKEVIEEIDVIISRSIDSSQ